MEYVWKDDTAVLGTRFELGKLPFSRGRSIDWEAIRASAIAGGNLMDVPPDIYVRNYNALRRIASVSIYELVGYLYLTYK